MSLPANVSTGTVIGHFVNSDGSVSSGVVHFTPSVPRLLDASSTPPTTILCTTIGGRLDTGGNLINSAGGTGVVLIATNDADLSPTGWKWGVELDFGPAMGKFTFSIAVPSGTTVDLATAPHI